MAEKVSATEIIGKTIVSEEGGKKFGVVGNIEFAAETGELINLILDQPTTYATQLNLKKNSENKFIIPFVAVKSIGDFVVISESELL